MEGAGIMIIQIQCPYQSSRAKQVYWLLGWVQSQVVIEGMGSSRIVRKSR